ncbi:hypothetical protein HaLaN_01812, partial [Haematococcus lacustris]
MLRHVSLVAAPASTVPGYRFVQDEQHSLHRPGPAAAAMPSQPEFSPGRRATATPPAAAAMPAV